MRPPRADWPVDTFLRTRARAMTRARRVLSQSPRKMAADGGLPYKETNKVGSQDEPETSKRCYYCPMVTLQIRGLMFVGPVNHEGDKLFLPSSWPRPLNCTTGLATPLFSRVFAPGSNPLCYSLLEPEL